VPNRRFRFSSELPVYINHRQAAVDYILKAIEKDREVRGIVEANGGATIWGWKGLRDLTNNIVLIEEGARPARPTFGYFPSTSVFCLSCESIDRPPQFRPARLDQQVQSARISLLSSFSASLSARIAVSVSMLVSILLGELRPTKRPTKSRAALSGVGTS